MSGVSVWGRIPRRPAERCRRPERPPARPGRPAGGVPRVMGGGWGPGRPVSHSYRPGCSSRGALEAAPRSPCQTGRPGRSPQSGRSHHRGARPRWGCYCQPLLPGRRRPRARCRPWLAPWTLLGRLPLAPGYRWRAREAAAEPICRLPTPSACCRPRAGLLPRAGAVAGMPRGSWAACWAPVFKSAVRRVCGGRGVGCGAGAARPC